MTNQYKDIMFTRSVRAAQSKYGSNAHSSRKVQNRNPDGKLTSRETQFLALRNSFYIATVNENGWPYLQHRGGPRGFVLVLGPDQIAFVDFRGNNQFISIGNIEQNNRISMFFIDYPRRKRLKITGHAHIEDLTDVDASILQKIQLPNYTAIAERVIFVNIVGFDWNCRQHIIPRYGNEEVRALIEKFQTIA